MAKKKSKDVTFDDVEAVVVIARFKDGKHRQVFVKKSNKQNLLCAIVAIEGRVVVLDEVLDGVEISVND